MFEHSEFDNHERLIHAQDEDSGLKVIIAIHSTRLGPAFGGCRMMNYASEENAVFDVLRLSRGMTAKAAICNLPWGGGKSVILGDPKTIKTPSLLRAMGRIVEELAGQYFIADDVGTTLDDLAIIREETQYTAAATTAAKAPLAVTAYGVLQAIKATARVVLKRGNLEGLKVVVQGLGNVGMPLCEQLSAEGASLIVTDIEPARVLQARQKYGARSIEPADVFDVEADIFAPCALGGILHEKTIERLKVKAVCGGANNQLKASSHARLLSNRGIIFVPDYLVSAGGVIDFQQEFSDDSPAGIFSAVEEIGVITADILSKAVTGGLMPIEITDKIVKDRLQPGKPNGNTSTRFMLAS